MKFKDFYNGVIEDCELGPLGRFMFIPVLPLLIALPYFLGAALWASSSYVFIQILGGIIATILAWVVVFVIGMTLFLMGYALAMLISWIAKGKVGFDLSDSYDFIFEPIIKFIIFVYAFLFMKSETKRFVFKPDEAAKEKLVDES